MQAPDFVRAAGERPLFNHRSPEMLQLLKTLEAGTRPLFGTGGNVLFLAASGTGAMESAIVNLTSKDEEIIVVVGGNFATRWTQIAEGYGLTVRIAEVDWREGPKVADVDAAMRRWPGASVVFITWSESSTGDLIPEEVISEIGRRVREQGKILVADAVSGVAVSPLKMDEWNIDAVIAGSQKGLMLPAGLGFAAVGKRAWEKQEQSNTPRFYWDWKKYVEAVPFTPALSLLFQLEASLDYIHRQGVASVFARRAQVAAEIRELVRAAGMEVYARRPGNGITGVIPEEGFDISGLIQRLNREYQIQIAGGLGPLKGKIFRIGHVGHLTDEELEYFALGFKSCLKHPVSTDRR
jgi:aspartate aminotransferase-like enzyme